MNRDEVVRRLDEIKVKIAQLRPTRTPIESGPIVFTGEAEQEELLRVVDEERRLLAMLTQPPGGSVE